MLRQGRRFCFTWNNPDGVPMRVSFGEHCSYLVYGHEVGEQGTMHLQGYVEFDRPVRPRVLFNAIAEAHFENARGSPQQNRDYCTKDDNFEEEGVISGGQGARSDINAVVELVRAQRPILEVAEQHPATFMRMYKGIERLYDVLSTQRRDYPTIVVICGPTGSGKSRLARELAPNAYWVFNHQWWDGYDPYVHEDVVWDEFYGSSCPYVKLLRILDSTPYRAERKGSTVELRFRRIIFTSNLEPKDWYGQMVDTHQMAWSDSPLYRRLHEFGRIIFTGEVHAVRRPAQMTECQECGAMFDRLSYHHCNVNSNNL